MNEAANHTSTRGAVLRQAAALALALALALGSLLALGQRSLR